MIVFAATGTLAAWLYLLLARGRFWLEFARRPSAGLPPSGAEPPVVAVIPARNEALVVARAIRSLAAQQYGGRFHIVLVDDHSTDGTAEIARAAAPSGLLTVVRAAPVPPGWTGKLWAVSEGIRQAAAFDPEFFLLTDADIVHPADNLRTLTAHTGYDLVSYMATLECRTLAERALIPAFVFFFFMLYPPAWIRDPRRRTAGAAGGCMLARRRALEEAGGIAAIRGELIDDCALARLLKSRGGRIWLGLGAGTRSIRPYAGFSEIGGMISRTAFTQLRRSAMLLAACVRRHVLDLPASAAGAGGRPVALWRRVAGHVGGLSAGPALLPALLAMGAAAAPHSGLLSGRNDPFRDLLLARPRRAVERARTGRLALISAPMPHMWGVSRARTNTVEKLTRLG